MIDDLRREVCALHAELTRNGLVAWTSGNLSARVPGSERMVIKASGVPYEDLTPDAMPDLPVTIEAIDEAARIDAALPDIDVLVEDGLVAVHDVKVVKAPPRAAYREAA